LWFAARTSNGNFVRHGTIGTAARGRSGNPAAHSGADRAQRRGANPDLVEDIIENALKMLQDVVRSRRRARDGDRDQGTSTRLQVVRPYAEKRKVTMFGSARTLPTKAEYQQGH